MAKAVKAHHGGRQLQERTWCVRATSELADWVLAGAADESVRPSVLIREAVGEYLKRHHSNLRPNAEEKA
ncbi:hypothetical protein OZX57_08305 [Bifidobacterium sp. ESL0682]|uniref:hypothetical protein n=1 Tax=Bifidobacterium sp. ESL0682 TaxID=2983212 RepID=UPI0023F74C15|nr:hypothetical protein [Bifidobacterium sp. ESL0682]WEV41923.1 hypothetical protein OZX57_08305 [Bifidobacterium sp. ESL0682]